jgi:hypothetical protein
MHAQTPSIPFPNAVDLKSGLIFGIAVVTEGPAHGHDLEIDSESIRTVHRCAQSLICEMAETAPESVGLSIAFTATNQTIEASSVSDIAKFISGYR